MIESPAIPSYKIKYIECTVKGHEGQKVNMICLSNTCSQNPLICSMCSETLHKQHPCKPLKFYLDDLYKKHKKTKQRSTCKLDELEQRKDMLLYNLKNCIEELAKEFQDIQEKIFEQYNTVKNQILDNEKRTNMFDEFYMSMIQDNKGDPHFEIRNFLDRRQVKMLTQKNCFEGLVKMVKGQISMIRCNLLDGYNQKIEQPSEVGIGSLFEGDSQINTNFQFPNNIVLKKEIFSQTLKLANNPKNIVFMNIPLNQWTGKLRITISNLNPSSTLTFGLIKKQQYQKCNGVFNQLTNASWFNNQNKHKNAVTCSVTSIVNGHVIDFFLKKNTFKAASKTVSCMFNIYDKNIHFFMAMDGICAAKINYPYLK